MKNRLIVSIAIVSLSIAGCQEKPVTDKSSKDDAQNSTASQPENPKTPATTKVVDQIVEASCGECQFGMEGKSCDLAIRIDGKSYFVDGSNIDDHGDAHGDDGLCNCIRNAKVTGEIQDDVSRQLRLKC